MKTESAASLLCGTFPINQLLSEPGEWRGTTRCGNRNCFPEVIKTSREPQFWHLYTFCDARLLVLTPDQTKDTAQFAGS